MDILANLAVIVAIFCGAVLYIIYPVLLRIKDIKRVSRSIRDIPSPVKSHWLFGSLPYFPAGTQDGLFLFSEYAKKYPKFFKLSYGSLQPMVAVMDPTVVKDIMKTSEPKPTIFAGYSLLKPWIGDGLLLSQGQKWFRNRKLLTPAFHFDILKPYVTIYNECAEKLMDRLDKKTTMDGSVDIFDESSLCTLEIILRCAFSYDGEVQESGKSTPYVRAVLSMAQLIIKRFLNPLHLLDFIYYKTSDGKEFKKRTELSHLVARDVIQRRRKFLDVHGKDAFLTSRKYVDFLDILLLAKDNEGKGLSYQELQDEVETFMFEGHDTTKSGISYLLYNLARHPDIQSKAHAEIDAVLHDRDSEKILWEDLNNIPYLTKCIKESFRLHPPVPSINRELSKDQTIGGRLFEKNTIFELNIWGIHHNPRIWGDDHMTYDPERFSDDNIAQMDTHAFVPFSAGPRNCIGQHFAMDEVKVTVARILRRFHVQVDDSVKVECLPELILRAKYGLKLKFLNRNICN